MLLWFPFCLYSFTCHFLHLIDCLVFSKVLYFAILRATVCSATSFWEFFVFESFFSFVFSQLYLYLHCHSWIVFFCFSMPWVVSNRTMTWLGCCFDAKFWIMFQQPLRSDFIRHCTIKHGWSLFFFMSWFCDQLQEQPRRILLQSAWARLALNFSGIRQQRNTKMVRS